MIKKNLITLLIQSDPHWTTGNYSSLIKLTISKRVYYYLFPLVLLLLSFAADGIWSTRNNLLLKSKILKIETKLASKQSLISKTDEIRKELGIIRDFLGMDEYDLIDKSVDSYGMGGTGPEENIRVVIFPVNPVELGGLITLAGSVMPGTDPVQVPQGPDCHSIAIFGYAQAEKSSPRAILGMWGVEGRKVMHKRFRQNILTLTLPAPLYYRMEQEADDSVLKTPKWKSLAGR